MICNAGTGSDAVNPATTNKLEGGYTLAGALILLAIMAIFMALAVESWTFIKQRENEEELIFRGKQYVKAIGRYHAKFNSFPPDIDTLIKQKFLRHEYKDPMTRSGKWKVLRPDSLVQTGAAGEINQPGQQVQQPQGKDQGKDQGNDNGNQQTQVYEPGQIPTNFSQDQGQTQTSPSSSAESDKNGDEDPESDVVGPIVGVVSRSRKSSIRVYNQQNTYNKWYFVYALPQQPQQQPPPQQPPQKGPGKNQDNQNPQNPPKNPGG